MLHLLLRRARLHPRRGLNVSPHHTHFVIFLVEIMQEKVAKRDKTLQSNPVADGQMSKSVLPQFLIRSQMCICHPQAGGSGQPNEGERQREYMTKSGQAKAKPAGA